MMSILFPNLPSLPKLITQMPQKELQILIRLRERILKRIVDLFDRRFLLRVLDLILKEREVLFIMREIGGCI